MIRLRATQFLVGLAVVVACSDYLAPEPFLVGNAAVLEFRATATDSQLVVGDTTILRFALRNPTADTVRVEFGSCVQIEPVVHRRDQVLFSVDNPCALDSSPELLELSPDSAVFTTLRVVAVEGKRALITIDGLSLPRGTFFAYGRLRHGQGRSTVVEFTIR